MGERRAVAVDVRPSVGHLVNARQRRRLDGPHCCVEFRFEDEFGDGVPVIFYCDREPLHKGDHICHGRAEDLEADGTLLLPYRFSWKNTDPAR